MQFKTWLGNQTFGRIMGASMILKAYNDAA